MRLTSYVIFCFSCLAMAGCAKSGSERPSLILATVGNEVLTKDAARKAIPTAVFNRDSVAALTNYRQRWIRTQLLAQEAIRLGLENKPAVATQLKQARNEMLAHALKTHVLELDSTRYAVSDEEAKNYYERYKDQFLLQERHIRFRHVVTETVQQARNAKSALLQGISWQDVVERYATNRSITLKNAKTIFPISEALPNHEPMHSYLKVIGLNEISPIREINGQYHFVQLVDNYPKGTHTNLDWLLPKIKEWLSIEKRRKIFNSYVRNLYLNAKSNNEINVLNNGNKLPDTMSEIDSISFPE